MSTLEYWSTGVLEYCNEEIPELLELRFTGTPTLQQPITPELLYLLQLKNGQTYDHG